MFLSIVLLIALAPNVFGAGVKLIANPALNVDAVSVNELKGVFLGETNSLKNGAHVEPVLKTRGAVHDEFLREYLGESDEQLQLSYRSLAFTGKGAIPKEIGSDEEVVAYVAKTRGAIGYIDVETQTRGVKTLTVMRYPKGAERKLLSEVKSEYPATLQEHAIGGTVRLQVTISAQGDVESVKLLGGNPILGQSAVIAVQKWKFAGGRANTIMEISIPFDPQQQ